MKLRTELIFISALAILVFMSSCSSSSNNLDLPDEPKTSEQPPQLPDEEDDSLPLPPEGGSGAGSLPLFG